MSDLRIEDLETEYKDTVILRKSGIFYHAYDDSAFVLCELFEYKVKKQSSGRCRVGFPVAKLDKVIKVLKSEHINIIVFDGEQLNTYETFDDNRFVNILEKFNTWKIVIEQPTLQGNKNNTLVNEEHVLPESNTAVQCISFVQGQGISLENAIMDVQTHLNGILESGKIIRTMSLVENTSMNNRGVFQVQGLVVYDTRRA